MDVLEELNSIGAIVTNTHVVYASGKHGSTYINKDAVYPHTRLTSQISLKLAEHFQNHKIDVVVAPALGAIILGQWVAHHLSQISKKEILSIYAEKIEDEFVIRRGYDELIKNKNCLLIEDVVNTGGSILKTIRKVRDLSGMVVGVGALANRGGVERKDLDDVPELFSLVSVRFDAWEPNDCPLCRQKIPLNTQVGKAKR